MKKVVTIRLYERRRPMLFNEGGLAQAAQAVRSAGRAGDDILIHINPEEFQQMQEMWGEPSINPETGLPEYGFFSKLWKKIKKVVKAVAPIAISFIPGVGPALGTAFKAMGVAAKFIPLATKLATGAIGGAISGGGKGALAGALTGGLSGVGGSIGKALTGGSTGALSQALGNAVVGGGVSKLTGGDFGQGALGAAAGSLLSPALKKLTSSFNSGEVDSGGLEEYTPISSQYRIPETGSVDGLSEYTPISSQYRVPEITESSTGMPDVDGLTMPTIQPVSNGVLSNVWDYVKENPVQSLGILNAVGSAVSGARQEDPTPPELPESFTQPLPSATFNRNRGNNPLNYYRYGMAPEHQFYQENTVPTVGAARGMLVRGPGTGRSDSIEARLSDGEYVIDAETVALLGDGSTDAGAKRLDEMRRKLRQHKGKALSRGQFSAAAKSPEQYLAKGGKVGALKKVIKKPKPTSIAKVKQRKLPVELVRSVEDFGGDFQDAAEMSFTKRELRENLESLLAEANLDYKLANKLRVVTRPQFIEFDSNNPSHAGGYFDAEIEGPEEIIEALRKVQGN